MIALLPSPLPGATGILGSISFEVGYILVTTIFWLGTLYFVDSSALAGRRSDPLLRDSLHWSKVRYVLWTWQGFNVAFIVIGVIVSAASGNHTLANEIAQGNNGATSSIPAKIADISWGLSFGPFVVFIPLFIRAKDPTLRRHFMWLAILAGLIGLEFLVSGLLGSNPAVAGYMNSEAGSLIGNAVFIVTAGYFLYRAARALVPLNRISSLEEIPNVSPAMP
jgi:hypothetical protein